jgi:hypothetical protein
MTHPSPTTDPPRAPPSPRPADALAYLEALAISCEYPAAERLGPRDAAMLRWVAGELRGLVARVRRMEG